MSAQNKVSKHLVRVVDQVIRFDLTPVEVDQDPCTICPIISGKPCIIDPAYDGEVITSHCLVGRC